MTWARQPLLLFVVAAIVAGALLLFPRGGSLSPPRGDPFEFDVPGDTSRGAPFRVGPGEKAGDAFAGEGSFSYEQQATGNLGDLPIPRLRRVTGTFTSVRRVTVAGAGLRVRVDATLSATVVEEESPAVARDGTFVLEFDPAKPDPLSFPDARKDAPKDLADALEGLASAWISKRPLPDRPVRLGETFGPKEVMDLEPMKRQLFHMFQWVERGISVPIGRVWVESHGGSGPDEEVVVRAALQQDQHDVSEVPGKTPNDIDYRSVTRTMHRIRVPDGTVAEVRWDAVRKTHLVSKGLDYTVRVDLFGVVRETPK